MPNNNSAGFNPFLATDTASHSWADIIYDNPAVTSQVVSHFIPSKPRKARDSMTVRNLLLPIHQAIGVKSVAVKKEDCILGIEIENEFKKEIVWPRVDNFKREDDHSLRYYGFEYVSKPTKYADYKKRVQALCSKLAIPDVPPTNSIRTSTHVHFDVTHMNFVEVLTFACIYWTLEDWLSSFAGDHRKGNLFCLRLKDAFATTQYINQILQNYDVAGSSLLSNDLRYASVNFAALRKFGTLEFRLMRGTLDPEEINQWIDTLEAIRKYSLKFKTPKEFRKHFLEDINARELPLKVLGQDLFNRYLPFVDEDTEKKIRASFEECEDIMVAHSYDFAKELKELEELEARRLAEEIEKAKRLYQFNSNVVSATAENYEAVDIIQLTDLNPFSNGANISLNEHEDI